MSQVAFYNHVQFANGKVFAIMTSLRPHSDFKVWATHAKTAFAMEVNAGVEFTHTTQQMDPNMATVLAYDVNKAAHKLGLGLAAMNTQKLNKYLTAKSILQAAGL